MAFQPGVLHVNRPLTDLVVSFNPSDKGYVRSLFFPRKPVLKKSDQIRQVSKGELLRAHNAKVGPDGKVNEVQFAMDTTLSYQAITYAFAAVLDNEERQMADSELQYDMRMMQNAMLKMNTALEYVAVKQTLRDNTQMTSGITVAGANLWDLYTSPTSDPVSDLLTGCSSVRVNTQQNVNYICMHEYVWNAIAQHPNVLSRAPVHTVGPTGAIMTPNILEDILRIPRGSIVITTAQYNAANEGESDSFKAFIGSDVLIAHVEDPSLSDFGLGHEFAFSGYNGTDPYTVIQYPDLSRGALGSDIAKIVASVDFKITNAKAGYLIKTTVNTANSAYGGFLD